ncbi:hypothetical protein SCHPADRAFT_896277 [Schizopora paradoxa]|uniref:Uncharacterized protein n=1 Tax=Schizopora paradoxa TaxID=27342 RepID=A0A0H2R138_9AGAM|nr:hypothetical protein SCHPADRAFT_896277 [Schizopora paradoxa]
MSATGSIRALLTRGHRGERINGNGKARLLADCAPRRKKRNEEHHLVSGGLPTLSSMRDKAHDRPRTTTYDLHRSFVDLSVASCDDCICRTVESRYKLGFGVSGMVSSQSVELDAFPLHLEASRNEGGLRRRHLQVEDMKGAYDEHRKYGKEYTRKTYPWPSSTSPRPKRRDIIKA